MRTASACGAATGGLSPCSMVRAGVMARDWIRADERLSLGGRSHGVTDASSHLWLDKAATDGVASQLDSVSHAELLQNVLSVVADRLDADDELLGDLFRRVGLGDQL